MTLRLRAAAAARVLRWWLTAGWLTGGGGGGEGEARAAPADSLGEAEEEALPPPPPPLVGVEDANRDSTMDMSTNDEQVPPRLRHSAAAGDSRLNIRREAFRGGTAPQC